MSDFLPRYWKLQYWLHEQDKSELGVWLDADHGEQAGWRDINEKLVAVGPPPPFHIPGYDDNYVPYHGTSMTYRLATAGWSYTPIEYSEPFTLDVGEVLGLHYGGT